MILNDQPTTSTDEFLSHYARQVERSIRNLAHLTVTGPDLTPAEVAVVLGHLAEALAALPQVATQLGGVLVRSQGTHEVAVDGMTTATDPGLAVDTACRHLDEVRGPVARAYRHLDAARNEVAQISSAPLDDTLDAADTAPGPLVDGRFARPEHREPPPVPRPGSDGPTR